MWMALNGPARAVWSRLMLIPPDGWTPSVACSREVAWVLTCQHLRVHVGAMRGHERPPVTLRRAFKRGGRRVRIPLGVLVISPGDA